MTARKTDRLAKHYIRAADLRAIYLAAGGSVRLGITRDPDRCARDLRHAGVAVAGLWWCSSAAAATAVMAAVEAAYPGILRGVPGDADKIAASVCELAHICKVTLTPDRVVRARAAAVAADVDRRVKAMQASGELRALNRAYRAARSAAEASGARFMPYGAYLGRHKIRMLYELASAVQ